MSDNSKSLTQENHRLTDLNVTDKELVYNLVGQYGSNDLVHVKKNVRLALEIIVAKAESFQKRNSKLQFVYLECEKYTLSIRKSHTKWELTFETVYPMYGSKTMFKATFEKDCPEIKHAFTNTFEKAKSISVYKAKADWRRRADANAKASNLLQETLKQSDGKNITHIDTSSRENKVIAA